MEPSPQPPPTLDLRGLIPTPLHRPRLAALACWILAFAALLELAWSFSPYLSQGWLEVLLGGPSHDILLALEVQALADFLPTSIIALGLLLLLAANIANGAIDPWPRRLLGILVIARTIVGILSSLAAWAWVHVLIDEFRESSPAPLWRFLSNVSLWVFLADTLFDAALHACALIYVLQLGAWLRSSPLRLAGALILGSAFFLDLVSIAVQAIRLAPRPSAALRIPDTFWPVSTIANAIVLFSLAILLTILALQLHRAARTQA